MKTMILRIPWKTFISVLILTSASILATAQKVNKVSVDTAINPHDFTDVYYTEFGVLPGSIIDRRDGYDMLSVFGKSSNPSHSDVRVLATLPAYNFDGTPVFWSPLGYVPEGGFVEDKVGIIAMETAVANPIYIFPMMPKGEFNEPVGFTNLRQATLLSAPGGYYERMSKNPLGLRMMVAVRYNESALAKKTPALMAYMSKKNGYSADGTPILKNRDDLQMMVDGGLVDLEYTGLWTPDAARRFAIAPVIVDPTNGAIASDAFLLFPTLDGRPLPGEEAFVSLFECLQKVDQPCKD